jgi:hypothetical protein
VDKQLWEEQHKQVLLEQAQQECELATPANVGGGVMPAPCTGLEGPSAAVVASRQGCGGAAGAQQQQDHQEQGSLRPSMGAPSGRMNCSGVAVEPPSGVLLLDESAGSLSAVQ